MSLSDRISMNIEAATKDGLYELSSTKDYNKDILKRIKWINDLSKRDSSLAPSGQTTQLVIGANDETDEEILKEWNLCIINLI